MAWSDDRTGRNLGAVRTSRILLVLMLATVGAATFYSAGEKSGARADDSTTDAAEIAACVERGVTYYREIGSYPTLSDGRDARRVAEERCRRTTTAF